MNKIVIFASVLVFSLMTVSESKKGVLTTEFGSTQPQLQEKIENTSRTMQILQKILLDPEFMSLNQEHQIRLIIDIYNILERFNILRPPRTENVSM